MAMYRLLAILVVISTTLLWHTSYGGPARSRPLASLRGDAPRSIRAPFRNTEMMTARGFGKRDVLMKIKDSNHDGIPWNYGKRETKYLDEFTGESDPLEQIISESAIQSFPIDWLANELTSNPILIKSILHRFVDTDKDGILTTHELLAGSSLLDSNDIY